MFDLSGNKGVRRLLDANFIGVLLVLHTPPSQFRQSFCWQPKTQGCQYSFLL